MHRVALRNYDFKFYIVPMYKYRTIYLLAFNSLY